MLSEINACIIVPTYNNEKTLERILNQIIEISSPQQLIVVNDGSTDSTASILEGLKHKITLISYPKNKGKGYALRQGFKKSIELGYENAITIDSDGQHFPSDIPLMIEGAKTNVGAVLMGTRNMEQEGVPSKSSFGNRFSNFWFLVETAISLPDTQTGFRLYPLSKMKKMCLLTRKFELEIEVIVRLAWKNVSFVSVPIRVLYDAEERVSHFRPAHDFFRISVLNTVLVLAALLYYYPKKLFSFKTLRYIKEEAIKPQESNLKKSISIAFGVFMGIFPIWGFQLIIGIPLAILFRMNKVLFITAANISIPPMIPLIVYTSFVIGQLVIGGEIQSENLFNFNLDMIEQNVYQYAIGAILLAIIAFFIVFGMVFLMLKLFRKN